MRKGQSSENIRNLSFAEILENLSERQAAVYRMIIEFHPISTEEVAELMNVPQHYITGRIKELRDELDLIEYAGMDKSPISNKPRSLYVPKKWDPQMAFNF